MTLETEAGLALLGRALADTDYPDFLALFEPNSVRPEAWLVARASLAGETAQLVDFLLLGGRVARRELPNGIGRLLTGLEHLGLCGHDPDSDLVWLPGLCLTRVRGMWLLAQRPQIAPTLYVGDDSLALANHLVVGPGAALDLCAGPGLQALVCSSSAAAVVAIEINPVAAALAGVNVALNGREEIVEVRTGDLYEPLDAHERFDLIVANPPLLPIPSDLPYPFVGDGGPDGLRVTHRILEGAPGRLIESGRLQTLGVTLSDGFLPVVLDQFEDWAAACGLDLTLTITSHIPAGADAAWTHGLAETIAAASDLERDRVLGQLLDGYRALGASHVCSYFLTGRLGSGRLRLQDVAPVATQGFWYI